MGNEISEENILRTVTNEALACVREVLNERKARRDRERSLTCVLCLEDEHGHNWVLTEQKCSCDCHQPKAAPAAMTLPLSVEVQHNGRLD